MTELRHILYVEDDPDIREVVRMALEAIGGYQVTLASSGAVALAIAEETAPDLILLDVMMPDLDGPSTLALLRHLPSMSAVPVVFITAKVQSSEVEHFKSLGAVDVIAKPFDPMLLPDRVHSIWKANQPVAL